MIHLRALLCCVAVSAACAGAKPIAATRPDPAETTGANPKTSPPAEGTSRSNTTSTPTTGDPAAHCLYVGPDRRIVRCYWKREDCEQQIAFNKNVVAGSQTCEAVAEAHCFDEN